VRFYRGVPASNPEGLVTENWTLDLKQTAFVAIHCWNIGAPDGPPVPEEHWVDLGCTQNHELGWCVLVDEIVPALAAARQAGLPIVHIQPEMIGNHYMHLQPPLPERTPQPAPYGWTPISDHASQRANRVHGDGYNDWEGWARLDAPAPLKPRENETMIVATDQFNAWLHSQGITTLIYVGFATNLCVLDAPAGMKPMAALGYRCVMLREATLAVEFPETLAERINTQVALRYIEGWVGYTGSVRDFITGCQAETGVGR
jgi:nicotinamidase-related amidase